MTTTLRARVYKRPDAIADAARSGRWAAVVVSIDDGPDAQPAVERAQTRHSHPEAMQAAYKLLADLDRELMDEVHESRASRRAAAEPAPHSIHHPDTCTHDDPYTMEATA